jgi:hypothetical protein
MTTPILLTETMLEGTTGYYTFTLDQDLSFLTALVLKLYDVDSHAIVNNRDWQDVLNTNGCTVTTDPGPPLVTTVTLELVPDDTVILDPTRLVEYRALVFRWTWNSGARAAAHAVQFGVEALALAP